MREYYKDLNTFRKLKNLSINFKSVHGYYRLKELKLLQHSGYALFEHEQDSSKTVYITVIEKSRDKVIYELINAVLKQVFWTSRIDLGRLI